MHTKYEQRWVILCVYYSSVLLQFIDHYNKIYELNLFYINNIKCTVTSGINNSNNINKL